MKDLFFINLSGNENVYFFDSDDKFSINIKKYKIADNLKVFVEDQIDLQEVYDIK